MSAEPEDGLWCRRCMKRHGYKTMGLQYEKRRDGWMLIWTCPRTSNVVGATQLRRKEGGN